MTAPGARREIAALAAASCVVAAALFAAGPRWADDWDGLGFLASVERFDLDAFSPHPPGYPVYVALLRTAGAFLAPMDAAKAVFAVSGAVTLASVALALGAIVPARLWTRLLLAMPVLTTPLGLRCATAVGSEAPALALVGLAILGLAWRRSALTGLSVGLALGVRLSWAPLVLPLLCLAPRRRAAAAWALGAVVAWAAPLAAVVGPAHLARLLWTHASGHATRWGGTALTQPARALLLARDLVVDGLGVGSDGLGVAIAVALAGAGVGALLAWRRAGWRAAGAVAWVSGPYLAWVAVGQNLREQPRHVLPLVALAAIGLGIAGWSDRRARPACLALFALAGIRAGQDALARARIPPPGAALVDYVRARPDAARVLVFGGASARFFAATELGPRTFAAGSTGDVALLLARVDDPPARVLVTSEIADRDLAPLAFGAPAATFCRPARIDRRLPCLSVYEVDRASVR